MLLFVVVMFTLGQDWAALCQPVSEIWLPGVFIKLSVTGLGLTGSARPRLLIISTLLAWFSLSLSLLNTGDWWEHSILHQCFNCYTYNLLIIPMMINLACDGLCDPLL